MVPPWGSSILFLVQEAADQIVTTGRPAPRAGLALLFLVQEAADQIATTGRPAPRAGLALLRRPTGDERAGLKKQGLSSIAASKVFA